MASHTKRSQRMPKDVPLLCPWQRISSTEKDKTNTQKKIRQLHFFLICCQVQLQPEVLIGEHRLMMGQSCEPLSSSFPEGKQCWGAPLLPKHIICINGELCDFLGASNVLSCLQEQIHSNECQ